MGGGRVGCKGHGDRRERGFGVEDVPVAATYELHQFIHSMHSAES